MNDKENRRQSDEVYEDSKRRPDNLKINENHREPQNILGHLLKSQRRRIKSMRIKDNFKKS